MESAASGILAAINALAYISQRQPLILPKTTMIGGILGYITDPENAKKFQPMGANFGILPPLSERIRDKKERYLRLSQRGLADFEKQVAEFNNQ
jgi:methylenetetrahydrofolate--tRNA-(uracil-5-)-methyltransferase